MSWTRMAPAKALAYVLLLAAFAGAQTNPTTDVLGVHDMSSGNSPMFGPNANACIYCHAPHNALSVVPLWNQTLSTNDYILYPGSTSTPSAPTKVGTASQRCLSCHDGSVAVGRTVGIGTLQMTGTLRSNLGSQLEGSHPFSMQPQLKDDATLVSTLVASHTTKDSTVSLVANNIECPTCHDVHNQYKDLRSQKFLVRDNARSRLCFACHDASARTVGGINNSLTAWPNSAHALSPAVVAPKAQLGGYSTVNEFACSSCHSSHNALGMGLLRKDPNRPVNVDETSQACITCHDGSDNLIQPILNVLGEFNGQQGHPFADASNSHNLNEPVVLDRNRHTTCADCHNSHAAQPTTYFSPTPDLRPSQIGVAGVTRDGAAVATATYQYENCLRCHGASRNKQSLPAYGYMPARALFSGDTLDVSLQFAHGAISSHPVMHDAGNLARPSLLKSMWNIGSTVQGRAVGLRILCTDCHNNDNAREFGGTGPNGPHGSKNDHILERQYLMSRVGAGASPGTVIVNLNPNPILDSSPASPYALCAKCHDLNSINSGTSWTEHGRHLQSGFSCSVCHSAHGVPAGTSSVSGSGLVSFDMNVVGSNNGLPVSYNGSTCTLRCHGVNHPD
ncbi:MAG TPA: cytochrome c3 family protein [Acidobacteriota bacterium]|nr:cytochrome c3 family protein [Acidobacteriota bacterium]